MHHTEQPCHVSFTSRNWDLEVLVGSHGTMRMCVTIHKRFLLWVAGIWLHFLFGGVRRILIGCHGQTVKDVIKPFYKSLQSAPEIICFKFCVNQTKFEGLGARYWFFTKSKMADIPKMRVWCHRVRWIRLGPRISTLPPDLKLSVRFKSYRQKCS